MSRYFPLVFLLAIATTKVAYGEVRLLVDIQDGGMAISGDGELISGILVSSPSGALSIATDGNNILESANPFSFIFTATPTEFHIRNDSTFITLDGTVSLSPQFDTSGLRDLEFFYDPPQPIGFVPGNTLYVPEPNSILTALIPVFSLCHLFRRRMKRCRVNSGWSY